MSNPGNTGQRFTKPKTVNARLIGDDIQITLECGHSYSYTPTINKEVAYWQAHARIRSGQRARCNQCKAVTP